MNKQIYDICLEINILRNEIEIFNKESDKLTLERKLNQLKQEEFKLAASLNLRHTKSRTYL